MRSRSAERNGTTPRRRPRYEGRRALVNVAGANPAGRLASLLLLLLLLLLPLAAGAAEPPRILAFGDSLTAGYGLPPEHALPVRLEAKLEEQGVAAKLINAGVSGDTTAGGLARLDWALAEKPDIVILELGANDALRGLDPKLTRANLEAMLTKLKTAGVKILLVGMLAPTNWGPDYKRAFDAIYPELARKYGVALDPFILDGVAMKPDLNQPDMLHPNEKGVEVVAARIAPYVRRLIEQGGQ